MLYWGYMYMYVYKYDDNNNYYDHACRDPDCIFIINIIITYTHGC